MICDQCKKQKDTPRTEQQNRALHKYLTQVADELNNAGYTVQLVLKEKIDLDWDLNKVKELLWRPAQVALVGKSSTTKLNKQEEITKIYEHLNRHLGEKFGVHVRFPNTCDHCHAYPCLCGREDY